MSQRQRVVTFIPSKAEQEAVNVRSDAEYKHRRVAAYARVSTNNEEQETSFSAQKDKYTRLIQSNDEWEFVKVYADEGISATSTKNRVDFNKMVADALDGKIDLIITKSVSRFARNTVDSLVTIRKLKAAGVEVYFEKENIYTMDSKGELLLTIMSSLAQEESRSISENVTWGNRKQIADGVFTMPYKNFLGYRKGPDGMPEIVEEEAETVRLIYRLFLFGKTPSAIAAMLTAEGIPTPGGKARWRPNNIISILTNEKYKGDALLQKTYTVDFLTKTKKINNGEVPQVYIQGSHKHIIEPEIFDLVQWELQRRKESGQMTSSVHPFSGKLFCGECGGVFGSKTWASKSPTRRTVWRCNDRYSGGKCQTPHLTEYEIKSAFLAAFNSQIPDREEIIAGYREIILELTDTAAFDAEYNELGAECTVAQELIHQMVQENATTALDQEDYNRRYQAIVQRFDTARQRMVEIDGERMERTAKRVNIERYLDTLQKCGEIVSEFDDELWYTTVDTVTVATGKRLVFKFKDGSEITSEPRMWRRKA